MTRACRRMQQRSNWKVQSTVMLSHDKRVAIVTMPTQTLLLSSTLLVLISLACATSSDNSTWLTRTSVGNSSAALHRLSRQASYAGPDDPVRRPRSDAQEVTTNHFYQTVANASMESYQEADDGGNHATDAANHDTGIHVATWRWDEIGIYFTFTVFIIVAGLAKVGMSPLNPFCLINIYVNIHHIPKLLRVLNQFQLSKSTWPNIIIEKANSSKKKKRSHWNSCHLHYCYLKKNVNKNPRGHIHVNSAADNCLQVQQFAKKFCHVVRPSTTRVLRYRNNSQWRKSTWITDTLY